MANKTLIYDLDFETLGQKTAQFGEPAYRATQIWEGLYRQFYKDADEFSNLPNGLKESLSENFIFSSLVPTKELFSSDGQTTKVLFTLPDGKQIETVLMEYEKRRTLCISTQAGCAMGCVFCATGQMGFMRNLSSGEIVEQVIYFARLLAERGEKVTNVVVMGMGEPFHNYDATLQAVDRLNHPKGFGLGARKFTISTVGLIPAIKRFTKENRQTNLAISLHAVDNQLRSSMLPINQKYPVEELIAACHEYVDTTGRRITFEWALIQDENDTPEEAANLAKLLKGLNCHVNIIPLNPTGGYQGERSSQEHINHFKDILQSKGIACTVRVRRGIDIQAGCGQLASET
ncbi:MAG: 23S rRNA (adenine(2503)-C(2))-methyltransferase RlmN [Anaerolineae bacterium]|nr:23S rRNA (adenine(2503)-C(2))-methyltransferase RlmN [Anaerolineae bacterium]